MLKTAEIQLLESRWDDAAARGMSESELLLYRSNILGADKRVTNYGGGNTSAKVMERDPLTGAQVEVPWVKGSGGDIGSITMDGFATLYMDKLNALKPLYRGAEFEDEMVGYLPHCTFDLNPRAASIDTPLHAYVPRKHVDHVHADALIALAASKNSRELTRKVFGDRIGWLPWKRPGYELGLWLENFCAENPDADGVVLESHGLFTWADTARDCYDTTIEIINAATRWLAEQTAGTPAFGGPLHESLPAAARRAVAARLMPAIRGFVSGNQHMVGHFNDSGAVLEFVNSRDMDGLAALGTSCPDHFLRTKIKPLYVDWDLANGDVDSLQLALEAGLKQYQVDYKAYYDACKRPDSPAMRGGNPSVILIPGIGMIGWGKSKSESRVTAEFYKCAIEVMRGAEAVSEYTALPRQEAFDIEYWALEEAKLQRMPAEKELARQIVAVVGAGSGIGKEVAQRLIREGAVVAAVDLRAEAAKATADEILSKIGMGIGVAGSGISGCGDLIGLGANVTTRETVEAAMAQVVLAYGGLDAVIVTSGLYVSPDTEGRIPDSKWIDTFQVNVTGPFIVADAAQQIWDVQNLRGSMVVTTSVNAVVPKKGSLAYDTSKAAANHLVRELAVTLAPNIRVNGVAPATVVAGSAMFPRDRVIASLAKYSIDYSESEDTESLRSRLANFYAQRTLTRQPILPADQAEAIFLLVSGRLSKTTGQVISVDGGLSDAFLR